ncbi:MAG: hypothetical protein QXS67_00065 [Candidatus Nezhaarchaeales archaeon]
MKTYEYIFAAIILIAMLLAATFLTSISPSLYRSVSEAEQLKMAAQKVVTQLLLSPGEPEDWGEDIGVKATDISSIGLAISTIFTQEAFSLDPDKVQRLNRDLPADLYIPPDRFLELLGLGSSGYPYYGVRIDFIPALRVAISFDGNEVRVKVTSEQGIPLVGANVTIGVLYVRDGRIALDEKLGVTNLDGECTINLSPQINPSFLVAIVSYYGLHMLGFKNISSHGGYLIGKYLLVKSGLEVYDASALQIIAIPSSEGLRLRNVTYCISSSVDVADYKAYDMGYVEPNIVAVVALTKSGELIAAHKVIPESYSTIAGEVYTPIAYILERSVRIGFSTYTIRLKIWRMTW